MFQTPRLSLEAWDPADWECFRPIATDPEVMRYINGGRPWTDDEIRAFVHRQVQSFAERGLCRWKLILRETGELAGFCGVGYWRGGLDPEMGWWLARRYWGLGLATEAARVAVDDAFRRVGLPRLISIAMVANTASRRIMEKLGFEQETEFEDDGFQLVRYQLFRTDYVARAQSLVSGQLH